jgi:hypothetical protein
MASEPPEIHAAALCSLNGLAVSDSPAISLILLADEDNQLQRWCARPIATRPDIFVITAWSFMTWRNLHRIRARSRADAVCKCRARLKVSFEVLPST